MPDRSAAPLLLAVDGGNTKTVAVVADRSGAVAAPVRGAGSDPYGRRGAADAADELLDVIAAALDAASARPVDVAVAVLSVAGADWPEDFVWFERLVRESGGLVGADVVVVNDAIGPIRLAGSAWEGIGIVCGTGNAVGARRADGTVFSPGFWPDYVGAPLLGQRAVDAVRRHQLGIGPATQLTARLLECFEDVDVTNVMHRLTRRDDAARPAVERMCPHLLAAADDGDAVAVELVATAGTTLGRQGRAAAAQVDLPVDGAALVLAGGVFDHPGTVLADAVVAELPGTVIVRPTLPPVAGALHVAGDRAGVTFDDIQLDGVLTSPRLGNEVMR